MTTIGQGIPFFKYFFLIFFSFFPLFGAGPVTHLYLAECYCIKQDIQDKKWIEDFIVGSLFPDIRYVSCLSREQTHLPITKLDEIYHIENGFEAGMKFHAWVDQVREAFVLDTEIYSAILPLTEKDRATLLKFIEEEILSDFYDGRKWSYLFDESLLEEQAFEVTIDEINYWHLIIQYNLNYRLSWLLWSCSYLKNETFGIPNTTLYNWSYLLPKLAQESLFQNHLRNLLEYFENCFEFSVHSQPQ